MQQANDQKFYRSSNRILGGVCAGLAEGFRVDPLWVRVAFRVLVFLQGVGVFIYIVLWLVMPERLEGGAQRSGFDAMTLDFRRIWGEIQHLFGSSAAPAPPSPVSYATSTGPGGDPGTSAPGSAGSAPAVSAGRRNQGLFLGLILVILGLGFLGTNLGIIEWSVVWPAGLITLGIVLLVRNLERKL
jgi:phage shock protein C